MVDLGTYEITPTVAAHVLWHFAAGPGDVELAVKPVDFLVSLLDTIARADPDNRLRLAYGFPGYVRAVNLAQNTEAGITELRDVARRGQRPHITCPTCQRTSYHPEDVRYGWCGHCCGYTSPPFGTPVDGPAGVKGVPHRYCDRCESHVATVTWRDDDHLVVVTGNLHFEGGEVDPDDQVRMRVWAPSALTWCSRVDWQATRAGERP